MRSYAGDPPNPPNPLGAEPYAVSALRRHGTTVSTQGVVQVKRRHRTPGSESNLNIIVDSISKDVVSVVVDADDAVVSSWRAQASVHRPQGQSSPLWSQWAAAWPLVPAAFAHPARAADPRIRPIFSTKCNANVQVTHATRPPWRA